MWVVVRAGLILATPCDHEPELAIWFRGKVLDISRSISPFSGGDVLFELIEVLFLAHLTGKKRAFTFHIL